MKIYLHAVLYCAMLLASACGSDKPKEDPLALERERMKKQFSDDKSVELYRAFKVALRGTSKAGDPEFAEARNNLLAFSAKTLTILGQSDSAKKSAKLNLADLFSAGKKVNDAKDVLLKTDEDSLPTLIDAINGASMTLASSQQPVLPAYLNESAEHLILGSTWFVSRTAPAGVVFYEMDRIHPHDLQRADLRAMAHLARGLVYSQNKYPYHSEQEANGLIEDTEKNRADLKTLAAVLATGQENISEEQAWHRLHGLGFLMRGMARNEIPEKQADGLKDWETFLSEAKAGGLDNELVWTVAVYVNLKNDQYDEAKKNLDKLAASPNLGKTEKELFTESAKYLEKRDADGFLTAINDKFFLVRLASAYTKKQVEKAEPIQQLKKTSVGESLFHILDEAGGFFNIINSLSPSNLLKGNEGESESYHAIFD